MNAHSRRHSAAPAVDDEPQRKLTVPVSTRAVPVREPATAGVDRLQAELGAGRDHRCLARVDGGDDLGVVDALQIDNATPRFVSQLPLDDVERDTLVGELDGVSVAQLVRREAAPHAGLGGDAPECWIGCMARRGFGLGDCRELPAEL
jgi:hypothetical protein